MKWEAWFLYLGLFIALPLHARSDTVLVHVPATGQSGAKAILQKDSGDLVLADITKDGRYVFQETLGRLVSITDPSIRKLVPKSRPVTNFLKAETAGGGPVYVVTTTGLSSDPETQDLYTGKPLFVRKDDLLIISKSSGQVRQLLRRSYDAIDKLSIDVLSNEPDHFAVVSTSEGQVNNSLIHIFRLVSPEKVEPIDLPEQAQDGRWQESFTVNDGKGILTIRLSEPGSFSGHPNSTKKSVSTFKWDGAHGRFVPIFTKTTYE
jgi:hypothetical protein